MPAPFGSLPFCMCEYMLTVSPYPPPPSLSLCVVREIVDAFRFFDCEWRLQDLQDEHIFEVTDALTRARLIQNKMCLCGKKIKEKKRRAMRIAIDGKHCRQNRCLYLKKKYIIDKLCLCTGNKKEKENTSTPQ